MSDTGLVTVRKAGALFPARKIRRRTEPDYRGNRSELLLQHDSVHRDDRVVLVDDWVETGSQALPDLREGPGQVRADTAAGGLGGTRTPASA
jgi:adenine phosphoribosyltransferase